MKTDLLASRHIGINEQDTAVMLRKIGVESLDELIDKTIPANIRLKEPLALTSPLTEYEFGKHIATLAGKNKLYTTYIGLGWYNTITPAVIQRNVFENPVWYTSYTPYQTEVSQGRLEALMNFQTAVCDLTAMPLANCSLLDEGTAAAEAVSMMYALRSRAQQKSGANVVFVDENIFPQTLAVMTTRAVPQGIELRVGKYKEFEPSPEIFACLLQYHQRKCGRLCRIHRESAYGRMQSGCCCRYSEPCPADSSGRMGSGHRVWNNATFRYTHVLWRSVCSLLRHTG